VIRISFVVRHLIAKADYRIAKGVANNLIIATAILLRKLTFLALIVGLPEHRTSTTDQPQIS